MVIRGMMDSQPHSKADRHLKVKERSLWDFKPNLQPPTSIKESGMPRIKWCVQCIKEIDHDKLDGQIYTWFVAYFVTRCSFHIEYR